MTDNPQQPIDLSDVRSADPVRLADLPSAQSAQARDLLERTMISATPAPAARRRSRLPLFGAAAAAVLLVAASFTILSPSNTKPALATVKAAAQEVQIADSGRVTTSFTIEGNDGVESGLASGQAELVFNGDDLAATLDMTEVPEQYAGEGNDVLGGVETRLVDNVLYLRGGPAPEWIALEVPAIFADQIDTVDPRTVLETVQTLVEAEEVGTDVIDGTEVTHYRSVVDLTDPSLSSSGWLGGLESQLDLETDGTITVELYVDSSEQLRRITVGGDLQEAQDGEGSATFSVSTDFTDLNGVDRIVAPEGVVPNSMLDGLFDEESDG